MVKFDDKHLLMIALAIGILGVGVLTVLSLLVPENNFLDYYNADGKVKLEGKIISFDTRGNYTFMKLEYDCVVDTVVFDTIDSNHTLQNDSKIIVEGNIQEYKGKKSIVTEKIDWVGLS